MMIQIAGMDPAFRNWGCVQANYDLETNQITFTELSLMQTKKTPGMKKSVDDIICAQDLSVFFNRSIQDVDLIITEIPMGSQSASASKGAGIAVGVLSSTPLPLICVSPLDVKLNSVGSKNATKSEMIKWATSLYPNLNWRTYVRKGEVRYSGLNEHLADAIAVVHAGIKTKEFELFKEHKRYIATRRE